MKVRRLEDIHTRYSRLVQDINDQTSELSQKTKELTQKSQNKIEQVAKNLASSSRDAKNLYGDLVIKTTNRRKFDELDDRILKFLQKIVNKGLGYHDNFVISESIATKITIDSEINRLKNVTASAKYANLHYK